LTEDVCPACDGTGLQKVKQPTQPGHKIYPAKCASLHTIAAGLNAQDIPTTRGSGTWRAAQVARVLARGLS
jgi:hypothetical protein